MRALILIAALLLSACSGYNAPSMSGDPSKMSADTLCFRYASAKDPDLGAEIAARGLDCTALLERDPLLHGSGRELDAAHRF